MVVLVTHFQSVVIRSTYPLTRQVWTFLSKRRDESKTFGSETGQTKTWVLIDPIADPNWKLIEPDNDNR